MIARALVPGACLVALASCASGTDQDSGSDAGCLGSPISCCAGGCNGDTVLQGACTLSGKWLCPDGYVSPADCVDAGVRWCGGPVMPG